MGLSPGGGKCGLGRFDGDRMGVVGLNGCGEVLFLYEVVYMYLR